VKTRAAVLFESPGRYEVHDVDLDPPTDDEVLVRWWPVVCVTATCI